jgi:hypothetical protein
MTHGVFITVIRSWRFTNPNGSVAVTELPGAYRTRIGAIHGAPSPGPWELPWPPFTSNYWWHTFGTTRYGDIAPKQLVGALMPLRAKLVADPVPPPSQGLPLAEVYFEPFGMWTALTTNALDAAEWTDPETAAAEIDALLQREIVIGAEPVRLRDGIGAELAAAQLSEVPWAGLVPVDAGRIVLVSGVAAPHEKVEDIADGLRSLFLGGSGATITRFTQSDGASAVTSTQVGIALRDVPRVIPRVKCLHHNHAVLFGHLLTFGSLVGVPTVGAAARPYQSGAARILNHWYRGEPLAGLGIYKSRAAPAWIDKKSLRARINTVTSQIPGDRPPPLP